MFKFEFVWLIHMDGVGAEKLQSQILSVGLPSVRREILF